MKLVTPVDVPASSGGFASFVTVVVSIAAPDPTPATKPTTYGGSTPGSPKRIHARQRSNTVAPPKSTGLRRPSRSDRAPSSGQPTIHPRGTIDERTTASP